MGDCGRGAPIGTGASGTGGREDATEDLAPKTPREARQMRAAFCWGRQSLRATPHALNALSDERVAAEMYPMPAVERPRVVRVGRYEMRSFEGRLQLRHATFAPGNWEVVLGLLAAEAARDLLNNPTERVPAEGE